LWLQLRKISVVKHDLDVRQLLAVAVCYLGGKERDGKQACTFMIARADQCSENLAALRALDGASRPSFLERAFVLQEGR
jgi:hypothetical protein|tara:strand:+ start:397 stop:633 length:237 start_codon:yes stop_codon:yes gene_type:complete